jgi:hypothetical protein
MHLGSDELIDLAERTRDESDVPHLRSCERCRRQLDELRAAMSTAVAVEVPEPSPLFWTHLSRRVHDAVSASGAPQASYWSGPAAWRAWTIAAGALAALVLAVFVTSRGPAPAPGPTPSIQMDTAADVLPDDPALSLVADLASTMTYDEASELESGTHAGSVDEAVSTLSTDERRELRRLLTDALRRPGD